MKHNFKIGSVDIKGTEDKMEIKGIWSDDSVIEFNNPLSFFIWETLSEYSNYSLTKEELQKYTLSIFDNINNKGLLPKEKTVAEYAIEQFNLTKNSL